MNNISKSVNRGDIEINMFLEYKNAFDTVSHSILSAYGIRGNLLNLCKCGLTARYQYVVYNDAKSGRKIDTCGVPQGLDSSSFLHL